MSAYCLCLIGRPNGHDISEDLVERAVNLLGASAKPRWLAEGEAVEIPFAAGPDHETGRRGTALQETFSDVPADVAVVPEANRRKALLIADMDSTIVQQECIDEIAEFAGLRTHISAITEKAMRGELVFEDALKERVKLLKDLPAQTLQRVFDERISLMPGARTLVQTMRAHGAATALVSGGFSFFTARVAEITGFQSNQANILEIEDEALTGEVREPILGKNAKLQALHHLTEDLGLDRSETLAVGDGANDLPMLKAAGLGVAYRAKPKVAAEAHVRIEHGDLTALLYLQGHAKTEFRN
ncbi:MAG: phosphoserine phosphatase SerB [Methyloligellaceae bacterium]